MMPRRRQTLTSLTLAALALAIFAMSQGPLLAGDGARPGNLIEPPSLTARVKAGELPPIEQRLPENPRVIDMAAIGKAPGRHGGRMRWLMSNEKDIRMAVYYSYARLVGYDKSYTIVPDILAGFEVEDGRTFTFKLRKGHRWSDGHPFTSEDFRYWWEDVANHPKLDRGTLPDAMLVNGKPPTFEVIDDVTVRYTWEAPNPSFLPALAEARAIYIFAPAHFLKAFHETYADPGDLQKRVEAASVRDWVGLHQRMSRLHRPLEPTMPVLDPWTNTTEPPSSLLVLERNPYFHRVDSQGRQLPYIDGIDMGLGSVSLVPAKTGAGDSDLQARYISFDDYTFLKAAEKRGKINVHLWDRGVGSQIALLPNLTTKDETWRAVFRDVRFRRALSLGINRDEINDAIYYGLARPSADTVLPESPLFKDAYARAFVANDPDKANALLDEAGLDKRASDGVRLLPDGRRAEIIVESAGESSEQADVISLIKDHYRKIGIVLHLRSTQRDLFRKRAHSGELLMAVWSGVNNGIPNADMSPDEFAPTSENHLQWPDFGHHFETKGAKGTPPDIEEVRKLVELYRAWKSSRSREERAAIWHQILTIHADQVFSIGVVNGAKQPVATAPNLRNVPEAGVYAFDPGAYFGIAMPDTFWFDGETTRGHWRAPRDGASGRAG